MPTQRTPLLIIAVDALDHRMVQLWSNMGLLPNITKVMRRGCHGTIGGADLLAARGNWLSIMTGVSKCKHGHYSHHLQLVPGSYDLKLSSDIGYDFAPFWHHIRDRNIKTLLVDPPESRKCHQLSGMQLLHWAEHQVDTDRGDTCSVPAEILDEVTATFGTSAKFVEWKAGSTLKEDLAIFRKMLHRIAQKGQVSRHLLKKDSFDLALIGFYESHTGAHRFWKYKDAKDSELSTAIQEIYEAIDREIGLLIDAFPAETNIVLLSALGMQGQYPAEGLIDSLLRNFGYQKSPQSTEKVGFSLEPLSLARRLMPQSLRKKISEHLPPEVQDRLVADNFKNSTDWDASEAFSIPSLYTSYVRVNMSGREPRGKVAPGAEYDDVLTRICEDLYSLVDPLTGKPAVKTVTKTVEAFGCDYIHPLPDLFADWHPVPHFVAELQHPKGLLTQKGQAYNRDSWHLAEGFFAAAGPDFRNSSVIAAVSALDLAPSFLSLLQVEAPPEMSGKVMHFAQAESFAR
jgi:predicted AlkP superfamily phosphohydrolase/phosphomutase